MIDDLLEKNRFGLNKIEMMYIQSVAFQELLKSGKISESTAIDMFQKCWANYEKEIREFRNSELG